MPYRGRFAPSPTGPLHFGSLVAAVASYLDAKTQGGEWLVRMEDLDAPRTMPGAADAILHCLDAFGLRWDGAVLYQSTRGDAYRAALNRLQRDGHLYGCACTRREIADSAINNERGIDGPVYPGTCRPGLPVGRPARATRVRTSGAHITFEDAIQGAISQDLERDIGDFVVHRADGLFAYQLAVVVDDAEQGITDVVRGADLLDSTPRQIWLQRLLKFPTPRYAHVPVAVNAAGEKLSKQTHARALDPHRPSPALAQALRFLGQQPPPPLDQALPEALWDWALSHWQRNRLAATRSHGLSIAPGQRDPFGLP